MIQLSRSKGEPMPQSVPIQTTARVRNELRDLVLISFAVERGQGDAAELIARRDALILHLDTESKYTREQLALAANVRVEHVDRIHERARAHRLRLVR
jgi:hypothetical protein